MSPALTPVHHLAQQVRAYGPALLATASDPHAELLTMVWGPRFDTLATPTQQRLRQLILRHRAVGHTAS
jgi:hypothetical protein